MEMIRVATFNVRGAWGPAQQAIGHLLAENSVHLVCLQECWASTVAPIRGAMGPGWYTSVTAGDDTSNVILSREPFSAVRVETLEVQGPYETRSAVIATIVWRAFAPITVCCTHLEQRDEAARLAQWAILRPHLDDATIVCGDLNALRQADYSAEEWASIAKVRAEGEWAPPVSHLTARLEADGFRDAWVAAGEGPVQSTCAYRTRIDYILLSARFPGHFVPRSYRQCPAIASKLSDHELVIVDVALRV